jgi:hypothetical protein
MLELKDGKVDLFNHITVASVTMAIYRALSMTEVYQVTVDGETFQAFRKGGIYYPMNSQGLPDTDRPIDSALIQDKVFLKSHIPQAPATMYTGGGDNYSKVSIEWLKWMEKELWLPLTTALSDTGGFRITTANGHTYRVEGYEEHTRTVYVFLGVCICQTF